MMWVLERTAEPEIEPVSLADLRLHLREFDDITAQDDQLTNLIVSAREWAEDFTGRALIDQTWRLTIDKRAGAVSPLDNPNSGTVTDSEGVNQLMLRRSPALAISSLVVVDAAGTETTVDAATYSLREADSKWPRIVALTGATWQSASQLRLTFRAGYADRTGSPGDEATVVPQRFKQAILLHAEAHYERDPATMQILLKAAENLIRGERCNVGFA